MKNTFKSRKSITSPGSMIISECGIKELLYVELGLDYFELRFYITVLSY